jgi:hypothetical protein
VPSGLTASVESELGGFFGGSATVFLGGSATVCGRCSLRADLTCFFDGLLASFFDGFSGGITGVASGKSSSNSPRSLGSFPDSTQRKKASFSSSIAAHPARPKLADAATRTSATRARARVDVLVIRRVGGSLIGLGAKREGDIVWLPRVNSQPAPMLQIRACAQTERPHT